MPRSLARALLLTLGLLLASLAVLALERHMRAEERAHGLILEGAPPRIKHGRSQVGDTRQAPPGGDPRVLVLGDSVTAGFNVGPNRAWPMVAERRMRRRGKRAVLINHAASGYDIEQVSASLRAGGWAQRPDRVVYAAFTNDHVETVIAYLRDTGAPTWLATTAQAGVLPLPDALLNPLIQRSAIVRRGVAAAATRGGRDPFAAQAGGDLSFFRGWARWLVDEVRARGVPLMVFLIPAHVLANPEASHCAEGARFALECREHMARLQDYEQVFGELDVPVYSALPALQASGEDAFWTNPKQDDPAHPNADGHKVLARAFEDALEAWEAGELEP